MVMNLDLKSLQFRTVTTPLSLQGSVIRMFQPQPLASVSGSSTTKKHALGKLYRKGTVIFREGEPADCMFIIFSGEVDLVKKGPDDDLVVATLGEGDMLGIRSLFIDRHRVTTAVARTDVEALTVQKKLLLTSIAKDPSLALRVIENLTERTSQLNSKLSQLAGDPAF
jgi:CRP-like cAMP-binding protein